MASITIYPGIDDELIEEVSFPERRCCFWMPCTHCDRFTFSVEPNRWWSKGLSPFKRIKEWSVLVAVPKLKTFIRRFHKQRCRHGKFQYDRASYLLNFDEGPGNQEGDDRQVNNFSTRYSSAVVSGKPSLEQRSPAFTR